MPTVPVDITLDWWPLDALPADETIALNSRIEQFVRAAFRQNAAYTPTRVSPNSVFSFSRLAGEMHAQFAGIKTLKFTNTDITSAISVPVINSLLITRR